MNLKTVFKEDFSSLPLSKIIKANIRDQTFGKWEQTSHHYSWKSKRLPSYQISPLPWRVVEQDGARYLEQPEKWDNVVICAGNIEWRDYTLQTEVIPLSPARCGILFHYQTSRHNYYIAFEDGRKISLYRRFDDNLTLLDSTPFQYKVGEKQNVEVTIDGEMVQISVNKKKLMSLCDSILGCGKIGMRSDGPVRYGVVTVSMEQEAEASFNILREKRKRLIDDKKDSLSNPSLVKRIPINIEADYLAYRCQNRVL
jgi:rhamnogalacturonan endolyase